MVSGALPRLNRIHERRRASWRRKVRWVRVRTTAEGAPGLEALGRNGTAQGTERAVLAKGRTCPNAGGGRTHEVVVRPEEHRVAVHRPAVFEADLDDLRSRTRRLRSTTGRERPDDAEDVVGAPDPEPSRAELDLVTVRDHAEAGGSRHAARAVAPYYPLPQLTDEVRRFRVAVEA
jgi:hypothetical protein